MGSTWTDQILSDRSIVEAPMTIRKAITSGNLPPAGTVLRPGVRICDPKAFAEKLLRLWHQWKPKIGRSYSADLSAAVIRRDMQILANLIRGDKP